MFNKVNKLSYSNNMIIRCGRIRSTLVAKSHCESQIKGVKLLQVFTEETMESLSFLYILFTKPHVAILQTALCYYGSYNADITYT